MGRRCIEAAAKPAPVGAALPSPYSGLCCRYRLSGPSDTIWQNHQDDASSAEATALPKSTYGPTGYEPTSPELCFSIAFARRLCFQTDSKNRSNAKPEIRIAAESGAYAAAAIMGG